LAASSFALFGKYWAHEKGVEKMSKQAKKPIEIPKNVEIKLEGQELVHVKGPKGALSVKMTPGVLLSIEGSEAYVKASDVLDHLPFLGLDRSRVINAIEGVLKGFEKKLELIGVGFRAAVKGHLLDLSVGFSHPSQLHIPHGVQVQIEKNNIIIITGMDKQVVGQFAASIRAVKPPEPYKGKGIRYSGEVVRRKAGKTAK
jgi:large subunit ribosomal protein L6